MPWLLALACTRQPAAVQPLAPEGTPCPGAPAPSPIDRELLLRPLLAEGADGALLDEQLRRLAGFYAPYGLRFRAAPTRTIPAGPLFTEPRPADADALLAPLSALLRRYAQPPRPGEVLVVLLPALVADGSAAARYFDALKGLSLSPELLAEQPALASLAELGPFTPTVLLSQADLRRRHPAHLDLTLAHELGHAAGLPHSSAPGDLMIPGPLRCVPGLDTSQLRRLEALSAHTTESEP